jgi:hypothetical protein
MNTITLNPKAKLLLGAGLDVLHFESREWMETIDFWKDEIKFFDHLLKKKISPDKNKQEYRKMLENLDKIHKDLFENLEDSIIEHEKILSRIENGEKGLSDGAYRDQHHRLQTKLQTFTNDFKTFKKIVFEYAKNI